MKPHADAPHLPRISLGTFMIFIAATAINFGMLSAFVKREGSTLFNWSFGLFLVVLSDMWELALIWNLRQVLSQYGPPSLLMGGSRRPGLRAPHGAPALGPRDDPVAPPVAE
jgi:hypothetical protein